MYLVFNFFDLCVFCTFFDFLIKILMLMKQKAWVRIRLISYFFFWNFCAVFTIYTYLLV